MKAARIRRFGPPDVILVEDIPRPGPAAGEVLVRVAASGVAPWDALIRAGRSKVSPPPPLTLGSDLSGVVEAVGADVTPFKIGDDVYGVTNPQFIGANAEFAIASAAMVGLKPQRLTHLEAASVPVVAVTAWQMLFEHARPEPGHTILILGAAGTSVPKRCSAPRMRVFMSSRSSDRRTLSMFERLAPGKWWTTEPPISPVPCVPLTW